MFGFSIVGIVISHLCFLKSSEATSACTLATKLPAGTQCKSPGQLKEEYIDHQYGHEYYLENTYAIYEPQHTTTAAECARICSRRIFNKRHSQDDVTPDDLYPSGWCQSFFYSPKSKYCQLGRFNVTQVVRKGKKDSYDFYDASCFDCGDVFEQPYGTQLLDNAGFENDLLGPWSSEYGGLISPGRNSKTSYVCNTKKGDNNYSECYLLQNFNQVEGELYGLAFDYKTQPFAGNRTTFRAAFGFYGDFEPAVYVNPTAFGTFAYHGVRGQFTDWMRQALFHRASSIHWGVSFLVSDAANAKTLLYLDNVKVIRLNDSFSTVPGSQLFGNGGFQASSIAPWRQEEGPNIDGKFVQSSPGLNSTKALRLTYQQGDSSFAPPVLAQVLVMAVEETYLLSFAYNLTNSNRKGLAKAIFERKGGATTVRHGIVLENGLHTYSMPITGIGGQATFSLQLEIDNERKGPFELVLDNFSLSRLPRSLL